MNIKPRKPETAKTAPPARKKAKAITPDYLHNSGLYYLQRFATSRRHFEDVMGRKVAKSIRDRPEQDRAACLAMVQELAEKFERSGLLNDAVYAKAMVHSLRVQGKSKRFILEKLKQKGLPVDAVQAVLVQHDDENHDGEGEFFAALVFARKRRLGPFGKDEEKEKALAKMARAGFSYSLSQKILTMESAEALEMMGRGKL